MIAAAFALLLLLPTAGAEPARRLTVTVSLGSLHWAARERAETWLEEQGLGDEGPLLDPACSLGWCKWDASYPLASDPVGLHLRGAWRLGARAGAGLLLIHELRIDAQGYHDPGRYLTARLRMTTMAPLLTWDLGWAQLGTGPALVHGHQTTQAVSTQGDIAPEQQRVDRRIDEGRLGLGWLVDVGVTLPRDTPVFFSLSSQARLGGAMTFPALGWEDTSVDAPFATQSASFPMHGLAVTVGVGLRSL